MTETRAVFSVMGPDLPADEFTVSEQVFAIGRLADNNLPLNHQKISRHHADITFNGNFYAIEDLESSNGTYVNDERLEARKPHPLKTGDVIRVGPFTLTLLRIEQAVTESPAPPATATPAAESSVPPAEQPAEPPDAAVHISQPPPPAESATTTPPVRTVAPDQAPIKEPPPVKDHAKETNGKSKSHPIRDTELEVYRDARPAATNGHRPLAPYQPIAGIPLDVSRYMEYLPGVYSDSDFLKRYLLIMESILAPLEWGVDSFEQFYNPLVTTPDWLQWIGSWFDILVHPTVPIERQRAVVKELNELYRRRGTRRALSRLLELYFGVQPEIIEHETPPCTFTVRLPLGTDDSPLNRSLAEQLITACKPAHTGFTLEVT